MKYQNWYYWNLDRIGFSQDSEDQITIPTGYVKLLNLCKKHGEVEEMGRTFEHVGRHQYFHRTGYKMTKKTFQTAKQELLTLQEKMRKKWEQYPKIFQLIDILSKALNSNKGAKNVHTRGHKANCYMRKESFIEKAISLARQINLPFFSWGCQYDHKCINYEVVLYFQIGDKQVSFHTSEIYEAPKFSGAWIGYDQFSFPFSITHAKQLAKQYVIDPKQIPVMEALPLEKPLEVMDWESEERSFYDEWY